MIGADGESGGAELCRIFTAYVSAGNAACEVQSQQVCRETSRDAASSLTTSPNVKILSVEGCDCHPVGRNAVLIGIYDRSREEIGIL